MYPASKSTCSAGNFDLNVNALIVQITITPADAQNRLDKFLCEKYSTFTRSYLKTLITNGHITVNDRQVKSGYQLKAADRLMMKIPDLKPSNLAAEEINLDVLYEDEDLLVVNKPAGLVVHPGAGNWTGTLVNALLYHCRNLSGINGQLRPGIVHRLDKNTSGLLVVAKNDHSHLKLSQQFESKSIHRTYHALVWGVPSEATGEIITKIGRSRRDHKKMTVLQTSGREAITTFKLIEDFVYLSYLEVRLKTGRTHQIRVHLNHLNHPVFGDPDYNGRKSQINRLPFQLQKRGLALLKLINRQALHATTLEFSHPRTGKTVRFESALPPDMQQLLAKIPESLLLK
jgi:23S rRNA pseudouridine1911/1915/1917 synthase